jgi:BMFP domain-containing protein YqiC
VVGICPELGAAIRISDSRAESPLAFFGDLRYQPLMSNESIDQIARKLADAVPQGLRSVRDDLEKNFRAVLRAGLGRLDLVTREEFEVQEAVLARAREKLLALEQRLQVLEQPKPAVRKKKAGSKKADRKMVRKNPE